MVANNIIAAIANKLVSSDSSVAVYADTVEQGLNVPCYIIDLINSNTQRRLNKNYAIHLDFSITYIGTSQDDARDKAELLPLQLATVEYGGHKWEGGNFRTNIDDKEHTVTCIVTYFTTVKLTQEVNLMRYLREIGGLKRGN